MMSELSFLGELSL